MTTEHKEIYDIKLNIRIPEGYMYRYIVGIARYFNKPSGQPGNLSGAIRYCVDYAMTHTDETYRLSTYWYDAPLRRFKRSEKNLQALRNGEKMETTVYFSENQMEWLESNLKTGTWDTDDNIMFRGIRNNVIYACISFTIMHILLGTNDDLTIIKREDK